MDIQSQLRGCLVGTAVGDALGLPCEGLTQQRQQKLFGKIDQHRFLLGRGMCSDDTEHTVMVSRALLQSGGDPQHFQRAFAWQLRRWILCLPAGLGRATLISSLKLLIGFPPNRSGIFSAGNGPAMRSALLGVLFYDDQQKLDEFVHASAHISHTDPKAETGALLVALAAGAAARGIAPLPELTTAVKGDDLWAPLIHDLEASLAKGESTLEYARALGLERGVTGYTLHTVPVALHAAIGAKDFRSAIIECIQCGGDTDTTAAIVGAITGAKFGADLIPQEWIDRYIDYPISISYLRKLTKHLYRFQIDPPNTLYRPRFNIIYPIRNLFFLLIILIHGFRRMLPPY